MAMSDAPRLFTASTSDVPFETDAELKAHYRSDWHRYNLKVRFPLRNFF